MDDEDVKQPGRGEINAIQPFPRRSVLPGNLLASGWFERLADGIAVPSRGSADATTAGQTETPAWASSAEPQRQCV